MHSTGEVFVHIDAGGSYLGNGGFKMLTSLAQAIEASVFDQGDRLSEDDFDWLCWDELRFDIVDFSTVDGPIITSWLSGGLLDDLDGHDVRYWEQGELVRDGKQAVIDFCRSLPIAINNPNLAEYYQRFEPLILLPYWLREDLFKEGSNDEFLVGYQRGRGKDIYGYLTNRFGEVLLCEGTQAEVADKMRRCKYFVFFDAPSPEISLFEGETCGLSLFEAMACGCICIARRHEGNKHLENIVTLVDSLDEIELVGDNRGSLGFIEQEFRFDTRRERAIERLLL